MKNMKKFGLLLLIVIFFLFHSCDNIINSSEVQRLIIKDGYFTIFKDDSVNTKCAIQFKCTVKSKKCNIGGYSIDFGNNTGGIIDYYSMINLNPGTYYEVIDTFKLSVQNDINPVIKVQAYKIGNDVSYDNLFVEYFLKEK